MKKKHSNASRFKQQQTSIFRFVISLTTVTINQLLSALKMSKQLRLTIDGLKKMQNVVRLRVKCGDIKKTVYIVKNPTSNRMEFFADYVEGQQLNLRCLIILDQPLPQGKRIIKEDIEHTPKKFNFFENSTKATYNLYFRIDIVPKENMRFEFRMVPNENEAEIVKMFPEDPYPLLEKTTDKSANERNVAARKREILDQVKEFLIDTRDSIKMAVFVDGNGNEYDQESSQGNVLEMTKETTNVRVKLFLKTLQKHFFGLKSEDVYKLKAIFNIPVTRMRLLKVNEEFTLVGAFELGCTFDPPWDQTMEDSFKLRVSARIPVYITVKRITLNEI